MKKEGEERERERERERIWDRRNVVTRAGLAR